MSNAVEFDSVSVLSFNSDSSIDFELSPTKEKDRMGWSYFYVYYDLI